MTTQNLLIEWRHLEIAGATCTRCGDTGDNLKAVVEALRAECEPSGVAIQLVETRLGGDAIAQSNLLLIDGRPLDAILPGARAGDSDCGSCGELLGHAVRCRTLELDVGPATDRSVARYEALPADLIRDAVCRVAGCC